MMVSNTYPVQDSVIVCLRTQGNIDGMVLKMNIYMLAKAQDLVILYTLCHRINNSRISRTTIGKHAGDTL